MKRPRGSVPQQGGPQGYHQQPPMNSKRFPNLGRDKYFPQFRKNQHTI